ncbi:hypothetical protein KIPB_010915, partial [Kipferlia bialata]
SRPVPPVPQQQQQQTQQQRGPYGGAQSYQQQSGNGGQQQQQQPAMQQQQQAPPQPSVPNPTPNQSTQYTPNQTPQYPTPNQIPNQTPQYMLVRVPLSALAQVLAVPGCILQGMETSADTAQATPPRQPQTPSTPTREAQVASPLRPPTTYGQGQQQGQVQQPAPTGSGSVYGKPPLPQSPYKAPHSGHIGTSLYNSSGAASSTSTTTPATSKGLYGQSTNPTYTIPTAPVKAETPPQRKGPYDSASTTTQYGGKQQTGGAYSNAYTKPTPSVPSTSATVPVKSEAPAFPMHMPPQMPVVHASPPAPVGQMDKRGYVTMASGSVFRPPEPVDMDFELLEVERVLVSVRKGYQRNPIPPTGSEQLTVKDLLR